MDVAASSLHRQEIIPAIRLGFAEIRSAELSKRFHAADADKRPGSMGDLQDPTDGGILTVPIMVKNG